MIRELTKSALSFSWALSLLGIKQAVNLGRSGQQDGGDLFAPVTQVAVGQLDESVKGIYRSGESLGSRAVDMAFSLMNPRNWFDPTAWNVARRAGDGGATGVSGSQAEQQPSTLLVDMAASWMNPLTWLNPANFNPARYMGNFGWPNGGCSSQTTGNSANSSASGGSSTGWGPMPGQAP